MVKNIIGLKFNRLTILEDLGMVNNRHQVKVRCDCGVIKSVRLDGIKDNTTKSCGCLNEETPMPTRTTHGLRYHPLYCIWKDIKARCFNEKNPAYKYYGERGISIYYPWEKNFITFFIWAMSNGWEQGLEIDRKDNNGNYDPNNCRCVKPIINIRNRSNTIFIVNNGVKKTLAEWAEIYGINYKLMYERFIKKNQSFSDSVRTKYQRL